LTSLRLDSAVPIESEISLLRRIIYRSKNQHRSGKHLHATRQAFRHFVHTIERIGSLECVSPLTAEAVKSVCDDCEKVFSSAITAYGFGSHSHHRQGKGLITHAALYPFVIVLVVVVVVFLFGIRRDGFLSAYSQIHRGAVAIVVLYAARTASARIVCSLACLSGRVLGLLERDCSQLGAASATSGKTVSRTSCAKATSPRSGSGSVSGTHRLTWR
jgi:hypothetical protein